MSYVLVVYAGRTDSFGGPSSQPFGFARCYYGMGFSYYLDEARQMADDASRTYGAQGNNGGRYAVHEWLGDAESPDDYSNTPNPSLLSAPVYVPPGSEDCALHFLNATQSVSAVAEAIATRRSGPSLATADVPFAPIAAIDPSLPMELEDGTPVRLERGPEVRGERTLVQVRPLRLPLGAYPDWRSSWWHNLANGAWEGNSRYIKLRNVQAAAASVAAPKPLVTSVSFEVRAGLTGTDRETWGTVAEGFANGKEAAAWVSANKASYGANGKSLHIVKREELEVPIDWRERERERLASGHYTPLPGSWADAVAAYLPDHFAHVAASDKRKVAFTETEGSGERDKQKVLSASEYAKRFLDRFLTRSHCAEFIADMCGSSTNVLFVPLGDADALEATYQECHTLEYVSSCMSHSNSNYSCGSHYGSPVRVYAEGGDITMALLRGDSDADEDCDDSDNVSVAPDATWDAGGDIIARCLVWPEGKEFGRVYGEAYAARQLRSGLEALGYTGGELNGAKIAKVPHARGGEQCYVMPYLDIGGGMFSDHGDYFVAGGDEFQGNRTDGVAYVYELAECERCNSDVSEDNLEAVHTSEDETQQWCRNCRSYHTTWAEVGGSDGLIPNDDVVTYVPTGRSSWQSRNIPYWELEANGGSLPGLEIDGTWWADAFACDDCGETFGPEDRWDEACGDDVCEGCGEVRDAEATLAAEALETEETEQLNAA